MKSWVPFGQDVSQMISGSVKDEFDTFVASPNTSDSSTNGVNSSDLTKSSQASAWFVPLPLLSSKATWNMTAILHVYSNLDTIGGISSALIKRSSSSLLINARYWWITMRSLFSDIGNLTQKMLRIIWCRRRSSLFKISFLVSKRIPLKFFSMSEEERRPCLPVIETPSISLRKRRDSSTRSAGIAGKSSNMKFSSILFGFLALLIHIRTSLQIDSAYCWSDLVVCKPEKYRKLVPFSPISLRLKWSEVLYWSRLVPILRYIYTSSPIFCSRISLRPGPAMYSLILCIG